MADLEPRVAVLESIAADIRTSLGRLEEAGERRFERLDRRFEGLDQRLDRFVDREDRHFLWLVSLQIGGFAALLGVMARGFHWI